MRNLYRALVAIAAVWAFSSSGQATVVSNTQVTVAPVNKVGANYDMNVIQVPPPETDYTEAWFAVTSSTIRAQTWNLDEGSDWYVVNSGDQFGPVTIAANAFTPILQVLLFPTPQPVVTLPQGEVYLGINTGTTFQSSKVRNVFGWLHLNHSGSTLTVIDSAMAYGEPGIIIGSTSPVPEPSFALGLVACSGLIVCRRRSVSCREN